MYLAYIVSLFIIIFSVSLDSFTVGITYGLRKIRIAIGALLIIMSCSFFIVFTSMTIGKFIRYFISETIAKQFGGIILIILGMFILYSQLKSKSKRAPSDDAHVLKKIMNDPLYADQDFSGMISTRESFFLGIALALDAFGAGFAASMFGYSPLITACFVALMSGIFLCIGLQIGYLLAKQKWVERFVFLPALLLICLGFFAIGSFSF